MKELHLLIDDERNINADMIVRNYSLGISALQIRIWDVLWLDHDLGEEKTGYDVMCWLEQNLGFLPKKIVCISSNPVGKKRINQVIEKLYKKKE